MISKKDVDAIAAPTIRTMISHYIATNHRAYQKEKKVARWNSYTLFLLRGGTRLNRDSQPSFKLRRRAAAQR